MTQLLITTGIFHPEAGGPATYLYELLPQLQARGFDVRVLTYGDDPVTGYPYEVRRVARRALPIRLVDYAWQARQWVGDADLIYAHTTDLPVMRGDVPAVMKIVGDKAWERSIRRGWIAPTTDIDDFQTAPTSRAADWQRRLRSAQVQGYQGIIVPSEYLRQMVIGWGADAARVHVVYNAMPPEPEATIADRDRLREQFGWDERPVILTAARLKPWKGVDHLMKALQDLPDARLVVAGDGDFMPTLRDLRGQLKLEDRVDLLGRVPRDDLYRMMHAADVFALYSGYEGLSHTILEALRAGLPVVASDKGGNPEAVRDDVNGYLVRYVDVDALADGLRRALDAATNERLRQHTQDDLERFSFERMVGDTAAILARVAQGEN